MNGTQVIVVTCAKDETWMMDRFLATSSRFADHIIVMDEMTGLTDATAIYKKYPKVILHKIDKPMRYDFKRRFVFAEARKIQCDKRIIVALDADEILSANVLKSREWQTVLDAEPGTLINFQWVTLWKDVHQYRVTDPKVFGPPYRSIWVDDGVSEIPEVGEQGFHMAYTPLDAKKKIYLNEIVCLHYQFCHWERTESKHRLYRAKEKAVIKKLSDIGIYRMYGYMNSMTFNPTKPCPEHWFKGWEELGIDISSVIEENLYYFDLELLQLIDQHGADFFSRQDIWSADWKKIIAAAKAIGKLNPDYQMKYPKPSLANKLFHKYVQSTIDSKPFLYLEKKLLKYGWYY